MPANPNDAFDLDFISEKNVQDYVILISGLAELDYSHGFTDTSLNSSIMNRYALDVAGDTNLSVESKLGYLSTLYCSELYARFFVYPELDGTIVDFTETAEAQLTYDVPRFWKIITGLGQALGYAVDKTVHPVTKRPRSL